MYIARDYWIYCYFWCTIGLCSSFFTLFHFMWMLRSAAFPTYRRDHANARLPRSSSIDSMVDAVWSETPRPSLTLSPPAQTTTQQTPQYLQISYGNTGSISRRESLLSPSTNRRAKQQRYLAGKCICISFYLLIHIWDVAVCVYACVPTVSIVCQK